MKEILEFLRLIKVNNNREWFNENKNLYLTAKEHFDNIANQIIEGVKQFDSSCKDLTLKDCTYRFYRDVRFSKDKSPYKTHFGVFVCPKGKTSSWAGYYFHIEPTIIKEETTNPSFPSNSILCCGTYNPDNLMLEIIRENILLYGKNYINAINKAKGFHLCTESSLKKLPRNVESSKYDKYIKLKAHLVEMNLDEKFLMQDNVTDLVVEKFKSCYDYVSFLNESISYIGNY
jgi:uncharacterized protein (TIGR02453 family)